MEIGNTFVGMINDSLDDNAWSGSLDLVPNSRNVFEKATHWAKISWFYNASADFIITILRWYDPWS